MLVFQEKLAVILYLYRINMQLLEDQLCVRFFLNKKKTNRSSRIRIERTRVRGSNKDGRNVFLAVS